MIWTENKFSPLPHFLEAQAGLHSEIAVVGSEIMSQQTGRSEAENH